MFHGSSMITSLSCFPFDFDITAVLLLLDSKPSSKTFYWIVFQTSCLLTQFITVHAKKSFLTFNILSRLMSNQLCQIQWKSRSWIIFLLIEILYCQYTDIFMEWCKFMYKYVIIYCLISFFDFTYTVFEMYYFLVPW